jgi:hypothetical protein
MGPDFLLGDEAHNALWVLAGQYAGISTAVGGKRHV